MTSNLKVRRRLLHWRPRWRGRQIDGGGPDVDDGPGGGGGGFGFSFLDWLDDFFAAVIVIIAIVVLAMTVVPAIVLVLEVLLVGLLALLGFLGRAALGRPWTVEAVRTDSRRVAATWQVHGFRRAGEVAAAIQALADAGRPLPPPGDGSEALAATPDEPSWPTA